MRIKRELLLRQLEAVSPGLAVKETIDQSNCVVFHKGKIITFNDEISCSVESPIDLDCAVGAEPLIKLLRKMTEDYVDVAVAVEEGKSTELKVKGKRRRAGIPLQAEILLPIDDIEEPGKWNPLPEGFNEALGSVGLCAGTDESQFILTCVHIAPEWIESCDNQQMCRYPMESSLKKGVLLRRKSAISISRLDMTEISESDNWLHFKNPSGVVLSCRRYVEDYSDLDEVLGGEGIKTKLPSDMREALATCEIFSAEDANDNLVTVSLKSGKMKLRGEGASGWYEEMKTVQYGGGPISFMAAPRLLLQIAEKSEYCEVVPGRLKVKTDKFTYVTCTSSLDEEEE